MTSITEPGGSEVSEPTFTNAINLFYHAYAIARAGKAVVAAVRAGFQKAFLTIIDTHVTTVVSCPFLFIFGTGPVNGLRRHARNRPDRQSVYSGLRIWNDFRF